MKSRFNLLFTLLSICIICFLLLREYYTYIPAKEWNFYQTAQHYDDTVRIAFIGDSWALGHKKHNCSIATIMENSLHRPVSVTSYGIGGLTSKEIYNALFKVEGFRLFMEKGYNYCVISAGINDCNKKMSKFYYMKNMEYIIRFMIANHIHPLILEIPDYNTRKVYETETPYYKMVRNLSMYINGTSIDCKQQLRDALNSLIKENKCYVDACVIPYQSWNKNYANDLITLYTDDQIHLNEKGFIKLDSVIAQTITSHYIKHLSPDYLFYFSQ